MKKATTIDEILEVFAPEKYLKQSDENFYVDLYEKDLIRFVNALVKNKIPTKSFFIAGQSGNGKSTILNLLTTKYPKLNDKYEFLYISGKSVFDYENVDIIDVLLMIGNQLAQNDTNVATSYLKKLKKLQNVKDGDLEIEEITSSETSEKLDAKAYLNAKAGFFGMLKIGADFVSSYNRNDTMREDARKLFKVQKKELINLINDIVLEYKTSKNTSKELLIVIDDLEKKENTDKLFLEDLRSLNDINITKIITMPIHLRRTQTFADKEIWEFALKLNDFNDNPQNDDKKLLEEVILKRIENTNLIGVDVINTAITYSGGNLRQLIKLMHFAANEASAFDEIIILNKEMEYSIEFLQRGLSSPTMMMKTFLKDILDVKMPKEDNDDSLQKLGKAIKMGLVFAYFNGKIWYEINPIIKNVLKDYTAK